MFVFPPGFLGVRNKVPRGESFIDKRRNPLILFCVFDPPLSRNGSAAIVADLTMPPRVRDYFETMMDLTGYEPLPRI